MKKAGVCLFILCAAGITFYYDREIRSVQLGTPVSQVPNTDGLITQQVASTFTTREATSPPGRAILNRLAYGRDWEHVLPPANTAFREWTERYRRASDSDEQKDLEPEGVALAQTRRSEMRMLIERDSARAIGSTVPFAIRKSLPPAVLAELETRIAGTGDYTVRCVENEASASIGASLQRFVRFGRESYVAHSYGRREPQQTKERASLHGIVLDGHMAVHESPLQLLEPEELQTRQIEPMNPLSGQPHTLDMAPIGAAIAVNIHGRVWSLADTASLELLEKRLVVSEEQAGPNVSPYLASSVWQEPPRAAASNIAWTTGTKKVLMIRVDFSDAPREILTAASAQDVMDNGVGPFFERSSYGQTRLVNTITRLYRMPKTAATYNQSPPPSGANGLLYADATTLAALNHNVADFDFVIILFPRIGSNFSGNGQADLGGSKSWITDSDSDNFPGTIAHELGHNFGLHHANLWQVTDGNPISVKGTTTTYGDPYDKMAGGTRENVAKQDFNPWFKHRLGWLPANAVNTVQQSGTHRVHRFDSRLAALDQPQALRIFREGPRYYWVGYRQNFPENSSLSNGAYITWGSRDYRDSQLLDLTTPGTDASDAALAIGATLADPDFGITIRPLAKGGGEPTQYLDVAVTIRAPQGVVAGWGATTASALPAGLTDVQAVAAGERHSLALKLDGTVFAWGDNTYGQATVPGGLRDVIAIAAGGNVSGAARSDGSVILWGDNSAGQTTPPSNLPPIAGLAIGSNHVLALTLRNNGAIVAWGNNSEGQTNVPPGLAYVTAVAAGHQSSFAINGTTAGGQLISWGARYGSSLGNLNDIAAIAVGSYHGLALRMNGLVNGWGDNSRGQATIPAGLSDVVAVAAGGYHSLAVKRDGTIIAWGDNGSGQATVPVGLPQGHLVAAGGGQSLALVGAPVYIIAQPQSQDFIAGGTVTFSVSAAGRGPLAYQWRKDGTALAGATNSTLVLSNIAEGNTGGYDVVVTGSIGSTTSALALLSTPVAIKTQPRNLFGVRGQRVSFTVEATGTDLSYQWRKNRIPIAGATQPTLLLQNLDFGDAVGGGGYDVIVSNPRGAMISRGVNLTVFEVFVNPPRVDVGGSVRLGISSSGVPPLSYQWRRNGVNIPSATSQTLTFDSAQAADTGAYSLNVSNADGSFSSNTVTLSVGLTAASILIQPQNQNAALNNSATLSVVTYGNPGPSYQWRRDGVIIPGATASSYTIPRVSFSDVGSYSVVVSNSQGSAISEIARLVVPGSYSRLVNLSVRSTAGSGGETLIVGFVVSGTGQKQLLVRGVGPTLASFGVTGAIVDPRLGLFDSRAIQVTANDDWGGVSGLAGAFAQVGAFALPDNSKDAALLSTLSTGTYTVQLTSAGTSGVALVEAYDVDTGSPVSRLGNLSVRTSAGTGANILIVGFVVSGNVSQTLVIRGIGPSLTQFGVGGALSDPQLALFDANGNRIHENDDWGGNLGLTDAFTSVGAFGLPGNSKDAALLVTLPPGAFSAQLTGTGGATGIALLEIYEMQ